MGGATQYQAQRLSHGGDVRCDVDGVGQQQEPNNAVEQRFGELQLDVGS
jgi:hypothetical protein